jgi:hypothetical protein
MNQFFFSDSKIQIFTKKEESKKSIYSNVYFFTFSEIYYLHRKHIAKSVTLVCREQLELTKKSTNRQLVGDGNEF